MSNSWPNRAACRDAELSVFFPAPKGSATYVEAKAFCERCPVIAECLKWAEDREIPFGMFGGMTPRARGYNQWGGKVRKERAA